MILIDYIHALYMIYGLCVIFVTEILAYLWHKYAAHNTLLSGLHTTHQIHHMIDLDMEHESVEDFIWLLMLIILFELSLGISIIIGIIPGPISIATFCIIFAVFIWNWWIHKAYHQHNHPLNDYLWFKNKKEAHFMHHYNPRKNYGISSNFSDKLFGTWQSPIVSYEIL